MTRIIVAVLALIALVSNAEARQRHKPNGLHPECNVTMPCIAPYASTVDQVRVTRGRYIARQMGFGAAIEKRKARVSHIDYRHVIRKPPVRATPIPIPRPHIAAQIVAHPEGCPRRLFCGCGAAVRIFGKPVRELWLAANWFRYPRSPPAPGMVAVRRGHVFVLEEDLGRGVWKVYDANSGRGLTRIHARSLVGYVVVNPGGATG